MLSEADPESPIQMTATIDNVDIKYDLTEDNDWTCNSETGQCTRSWSVDQFDSDEGEKTFTDGNLILKKRVAQECKDTKVDDVTICIAEGHDLEFICKYPLETQTVKSTYDVTGHDTNVSKEGVGKLNYKLVATKSVEIGNKINVEVEAINKGLVWHSLQDCSVSKGDENVSILNWNKDVNSLVSFCPNVLNAAIQTTTHQDVTKFSWTAFKWTTSTQGDVERQTIQCTISLSKDKPTIKTPSCEEQQATSTTSTTTTKTTTTTTTKFRTPPKRRSFPKRR